VKYTLKTAKPRGTGLNLDEDLNPQQRAVVQAPPGEILVLAGAGTGKTRTLIYRVARLVQLGCPPERIMVVTFTNRAARELVQRVEATLGVDMHKAAAGTFHHVGHRILRRHGEALGLSLDFGILDPEDARDLISGCIAEEGLPALTARRFPQAKVLSTVISLSTGTRRTIKDTLDRRYPRFLDHAPAIERIAERYATRKRRLNVCDFDDLLNLWLKLMRDPEHTAIAETIRGSHDHVLVDEYQDINALQGALVDEMSRVHGSLTCVGDDAQSIYSFRGADFEQILRFAQRHKKAELMRLTINYRSIAEILDLANRSIAKNEDQHPKALTAVRPNGPKPAVIPLRDVYQQAELVAQRVLELHHEQGLPLHKQAVLYRNHAHSLELQVELTRRQIPYSVRSGMRFFEQAHIKDVVSYLRARENPRDGLAWVRLLRLWPGIGLQTAELIAKAISGEDGGEPIAKRDLLKALQDFARRGKGRARPSLERLAKLWELLENPEYERPSAAIRVLLERHYSEYANRAYANADQRKEDLEHLAGFADRYDESQSFLSELALIAGITAEQILGAEEPDDKLILSTIHQAKGLEWPAVFVMWLSEGRFPSAQAIKARRELEEERRLFYVAVTRAADELYLLYPTVEEGRDGPSKLLRPSRFLAEVDHSPPVFERWEIEEAPLEED
jgi:DNA helicase-2/ATP-dependent DNA helicase PcrA